VGTVVSHPCHKDKNVARMGTRDLTLTTKMHQENGASQIKNGQPEGWPFSFGLMVPQSVSVR
jgi:hypothetical protein